LACVGSRGPSLVVVCFVASIGHRWAYFGPKNELFFFSNIGTRKIIKKLTYGPRDVVDVSWVLSLCSWAIVVLLLLCDCGGGQGVRELVVGDVMTKKFKLHQMHSKLVNILYYIYYILL
jgi:hypothetical protein